MLTLLRTRESLSGKVKKKDVCCMKQTLRRFKKSIKQQKTWLFSVGSILLILSVVFIAVWPTISESIVNSMLPLSPVSPLFSKWVITPVPLYFNFYMFNWTNSHMANDSSVKPNFAELGPYVFREVKIKEDLEWNNDEHLVTYYGRRTWHFEEAKSNGSLEDLITAPHVLTVGGAKVIKDFHPILHKIVNFALNREGGKLATTHKVKEWLFDGIYDDIKDLIARLHSPVLSVKGSHFGYLYNRNGSKEVEGNFTINTGTKDLSRLGDLTHWKGSNHTQYWEGECGRVNGSTGELWSPGKKWHDPVTIFFSDAYRFLNIFPQTNESFRGIAARRYTSTELTLDSGHKAEETKCFCVKGRQCPKPGVVDFSPASSMMPLYISHPHFNLADPSFLANTTGLKPDPQKDIINIILEPNLGVPLDIDGRIMISMLVEKDENIDLLKDLAWNFYAPLVSIQIRTTLSDELLGAVKFTLNLPRIGQYFGMAFAILGIVIICVGVYITKKHQRRGDIVAMKKRTI